MSAMPRSEIFDDIYFCPADGRGETQHVFLQGNNLPERWKKKAHFTVGETGFGTGLNFLLTTELFTRTADKAARLEYISFERYPLEGELIATALAPFKLLHLNKLLTQYPLPIPGWYRLIITPQISLMLIFGDANEEISRLTQSVDAWFLDGFAPSKNPQMWTPEIFQNMARLSQVGTSFSTFTAAGRVNRGLQDVGFHVLKSPGFGQKREMLRGTFG